MSPAGGGPLGGRSKGPLRIAIEDFLSTFGFGKRVETWWRALMDALESEAIDIYDSLLTSLGIRDAVPEQVRPDTLRRRATHAIGLIALIVPFLWGLVQEIVQVVIRPFLRPFGYAAEALAANRHADAPLIAQMLIRSPDLEAQLKSLVAGTGVDKVTWSAYQALARQLLTYINIEQLRLRGAWTDEQAHTELARIGYSKDDIDGLDELSHIIPGPTDLIQMAVREAWTEETVSRFQYDAGFDQISEAVGWMKKQGLSEDWAKRYWRAHWQLPGIAQVYEMLHRLRSGENETNIDDVRLLLKTADIPQFWRDRLIAISYNPYTRIDIRRMYKTRTLSADEVYQANLDIGYDEQHARKLTEWITREQNSDKSDLTRDAILRAYKTGLISSSKAKESLDGIGISGDDADFYIKLADYDIHAQSVSVQLDVIQAKFVNGTLDEAGLAGELGKLNLPSERTTALQALWLIQRNNRVNVPSRGELDDLLRRGIIDHDKYKVNLKLDGFASETIEWFSKRIDIIIKDDAADEAARKQTEQDRLAASKKSSEYQRKRADLDVEIAQLRLNIADITLALHDVTDETQRKQMSETAAQAKHDIVDKQLQLSQLRVTFLAPPAS